LPNLPEEHKLASDWLIYRKRMATMTAFQAKIRFGALLDRVACGEEIVITRYDKAVARLVPEGGASLERQRHSVGELRALRAAMARRTGYKPLSRQEIKAAIEEGRP
jgi:antitoxin (DNA-binding transcriptional repressor) of toxin-antitoxin stability system